MARVCINCGKGIQYGHNVSHAKNRTRKVFLIVQINLYLAIFNLLPIPPLDGSKVFALLLPDELSQTYLSIGSIGVFILFALLSFPIGGFYLPDFMQHLYAFISRLLGM